MNILSKSYCFFFSEIGQVCAWCEKEKEGGGWKKTDLCLTKILHFIDT